MLFYTSIGPQKDARDGADQWAAVAADEDLITWRKHPRNPVLDESLHGDLKVYDWRDPFFFRHAGSAWLALGGNLNDRQGGGGSVELYRATDDELSRWGFRGVLFRHPDLGVENLECPNFFPLGDRWVLLVSPHGPVEYFVGDFDPEAGTFESETRGVVADTMNFYASNSLLDAQGRRILLGWGRGFAEGRGWNGCMTLPKVLSLDADGTLVQAFLPELSVLRGEHCSVAGIELDDSSREVAGIEDACLEVQVEFAPGNATQVGLRLLPSDVAIAWDGSALDVAGAALPCRLRKGEESLKLHLFVDRSFLEVIADNRACAARAVNVDGGPLKVELFAAGGTATVLSCDVWRIGPAS